MKKTAYLITVLFALLMISSCGSGDSGPDDVDYETALFLAYSTSNYLEPMHAVAFGDVSIFIKDMGTRTIQYISSCGTSCQTTINLSSPPAGFLVPVGVSGTISISNILDLTNLKVTADLNLNEYKDITGNKSYSGIIEFIGNGINQSFSDMLKTDVTIPNLKITYTDLKYSQASFTSYSISVDNSVANSPKCTLGGDLTVGDRGYGYNGFTFQTSTSLLTTVSGDLFVDSYRFNISGSPQADAQMKWRSGTIILAYKEGSDDVVTNTCTVTLSTSTATFKVDEEDSWEWLFWMASERCP